MDKEKLYKELIKKEIEGGLNGLDFSKFIKEMKNEGKNQAEVEKGLAELKEEGLLSGTLEVGDMGEVTILMLVNVERAERKLLEELTKDYKPYEITIISEGLETRNTVLRKERPRIDKIRERVGDSRVIKDLRVEVLDCDVIDCIR